MNSYRLQINNYDESTVTSAEISEGAIGYTVVKSPKGPSSNKPVLITNVAQLHKVFGKPSSSYPELFEAETFIANGHRLYVCSAGAAEGEANTKKPDGNACSEGHFIVVSSQGNFEAVPTFEYKDDVVEFVENGDASQTCSSLEKLVTKDGVEVIYDHIGKASRGKDSSGAVLIFIIKKAGSEGVNALEGSLYCLQGFTSDNIELSVTGGSVKEGGISVGEVVFYDSEKGMISNNLGESDDSSKYYLALKITGGEGDATTSISKEMIDKALKDNSLLNVLSLERVATIPQAEIKALIFPKNATSQEMTISFDLKEDVGKSDAERLRSSDLRNKLSITVGSSEYLGVDTIEGTIDTSDYDSSQFNDAANSSYDQDAIAIYIIDHFTDEELTANAVATIEKSKVENTITLPAGIKLTASDDSIAEAWACAEDSEFDDVVIFFDSAKHEVTGKEEDTSGDTLSSGFTELKSSRPLCNFIYNMTVAKNAISNAPACTLGYNFYTISNLKKVTYLDPVATSFKSPCTGAYASMIATIIDNAYGGVAPMFLNSNGMGGQLSFPAGNVKVYSKMVYNYSSDDQKALEKKNYNPIIFDNTYGTMVVAQRTNADGVLTDWSYIGHVCSFLLLQREIRTNVMIPQLGKANNDYYRTLRAEQVSQLLRYRLEGSNAIWNTATVDTSTNAGVNDTAAQKAKKFVINVRVKPEPYSEYVVLNFTNYNDSSSETSIA